MLAGDPDGDGVVYAPVGALPAGAFFNPVTGLFEWTPGYDQAGSYTLRFSVTDPAGLSDELAVPVRIADVNRLPQMALENRQVPLGERLTFIVQASDPDLGETLVYSARALADLDRRATW